MVIKQVWRLLQSAWPFVVPLNTVQSNTWPDTYCKKVKVLLEESESEETVENGNQAGLAPSPVCLATRCAFD